MRPVPTALLLLIALGLSDGARADIFAFTDAGGGVHYTNVPTDERFARVLIEPAPEGSEPSVRADAGWHARLTRLAPVIEAAARSTAVRPELLKAIIAVESGFDARAVSRKGAQGLMQLLPATARRYGVREPFDPAENVDGGARYVRDLLKRYDNDLKLVLAAYNAGEDSVERFGRQIPPYPETRAYVPAVLRRLHEFSVDPAYRITLPPAT
jgi:soluble lytic murein transglycosylase-like protein